MSVWKDMKTAPLDGTPILARMVGYTPIVCEWVPSLSRWVGCDHLEVNSNGFASDEDEAIVMSGDWVPDEWAYIPEDEL